MVNERTKKVCLNQWWALAENVGIRSEINTPKRSSGPRKWNTSDQQAMCHWQWKFGSRVVSWLVGQLSILYHWHGTLRLDFRGLYSRRSRHPDQECRVGSLGWHNVRWPSVQQSSLQMARNRHDHARYHQRPLLHSQLWWSPSGFEAQKRYAFRRKITDGKVLYVKELDLWKIADFGFAAEGSSKEHRCQHFRTRDVELSRSGTSSRSLSIYSKSRYMGCGLFILWNHNRVEGI